MLLGVAEVRSLRAGHRADRDRAAAVENQVRVRVIAAMQSAVSTPKTGERDVVVVLTLASTVPVTVERLALDGNPPVLFDAPTTRAGATAERSLTHQVRTHWAVRCAEVGTSPGPRLLDLIVLGRYGQHAVRVRLFAGDTQTIPDRTYRLAAAQACES